MNLKDTQTYNNMLKRIEYLTNTIEKNDIDLDELIKNVKEGYDLLDKMKVKLENAKLIIKDIEEKHEKTN
jgi:exodeoxyribonuclease VII small subunit